MASPRLVALSGSAARYAIALYGYAEDVDRLTPVITNMTRLGQVIDQSADLQRVLASPLTDAKAARRALRMIIRQQELGIVARRLVDVLITNRRLPLLREVVAAFEALVASKRGIVTAQVSSARPMTELQERQLHSQLIQLGYGTIRIEQHVDAALLGGIVVRVGARLYDSSLSSRLQRLQYSMKEAA